MSEWEKNGFYGNTYQINLTQLSLKMDGNYSFRQHTFTEFPLHNRDMF